MTASSSGQQQTYFAQPQLVEQIASMLAGVGQGAGGQYGAFIQDPTRSPLYQNQLTGLLQALVPSERQAQVNLADMFRGAGNLASSQFGGAASQLQGNILRNRQTLASQLLGQMFPQMTQALMAPMGLAGQLVNALKLSSGSQQFQQQATEPEGRGGAFGGGAGGLSTSPGGFGGIQGYGVGPQYGGFDPLSQLFFGNPAYLGGTGASTGPYGPPEPQFNLSAYNPGATPGAGFNFGPPPPPPDPWAGIMGPQDWQNFFGE